LGFFGYRKFVMVEGAFLEGFSHLCVVFLWTGCGGSRGEAGVRTDSFEGVKMRHLFSGLF
jgi:hypothetical protein